MTGYAWLTIGAWIYYGTWADVLILIKWIVLPKVFAGLEES